MLSESLTIDNISASSLPKEWVGNASIDQDEKVRITIEPYRAVYSSSRKDMDGVRRLTSRFRELLPPGVKSTDEDGLYDEAGDDAVIVSPIAADPIRRLGTGPVAMDVSDASENHDEYIYLQ